MDNININPYTFIPALVSFANNKELMGDQLVKSEDSFAFEAFCDTNKAIKAYSPDAAKECYSLIESEVKKCINTLIEIKVLFRLQTPNGEHYITSRKIFSNAEVYHYRPHRGGLEDAMKQAVPFITLCDLESIIRKQFPETNGIFNFQYARYDERINWNTYMITKQDQAGVLGFVNANPNFLPANCEPNELEI